eukprot:TRINITY_DN573_c0_g1_i1.p8 TRINITY_DN573_c0_g1~~TRINITY_DN573_c0_g1_i1.p8  ORF type:complete len:64 (+),score=6.13 TRINITY_DN573_c0_g1_i1:1069-1260(+)
MSRLLTNEQENSLLGGWTNSDRFWNLQQQDVVHSNVCSVHSFTDPSDTFSHLKTFSYCLIVMT